MGLRWDEAAEQVTLGGMMLSPAAVEDVAEACAPRDFYRPAHQVIAEVILSLHANGEPADAVSVASALARQGDLGKCGGAPYLHTLIAAVPVAANAGYYGRIVRDWAIRRRVEEAGTRMVQRSGEPSADVADILAGAESDLAEAVVLAETGPTGLVTAEAFCEQDLASAAPVIPGLLYAQERVVTVADEGAGKSTLARQIWVCAAAGVHPFTGESVPPKRALLMDFENPAHILQTRIPSLLEAARRHGDYDPDRCRILHRPGGVDLASPADQARMTAVVKAARPDLIVAGPIYRMTPARGERAEPAHAAVAAYLDKLRERFNVALWLETHAPMRQQGVRDMRPLDWGGWMRWPEFGLALKLIDPGGGSGALRLSRFRFDRDGDRLWPQELHRSRWGGTWPWPWEAKYGTGDLAVR